ncbi:het domain-containing protein [Stagonosporopsis vannaccii]|nr:het domain-containing protein [Stagonosporopsis vannaccii]
MPPQSNVSYSYTPLPTGPYIRILRLDRGHQSDPLSGDLHIHHIHETGSYEPLSYVWGDSSRCSEFFCRGRTIALTTNLQEALRRLRRQDRPRYLWVDQLCINQDDQMERSRQVQHMNTIYKNATHVLVWLGNDPLAEARGAFELIHSLAQTFNSAHDKEAFRVRYTERLHDQSHEYWEPLKHLCNNVWFTRGWVVQEIGTKAPATLYWGDLKCDWALISGVVQELANFHHMRGRFNLKTSLIKYMFRRFIEPPGPSRHDNRFSLMYELQRARHCKLSDPRDRVFMFLGHYSMRMGNSLLEELQADYSKTVEEVYFDVAKRALLGDPEKSLITLAAIQHRVLPTRPGVKYENDLPSWVPDWRHFENHIMSEPVSPHCAHGNKNFRVSIEGNRLFVRGSRVDSVEVCSKPLKWKEFHYDPSRKDLAIVSLWTDICGKAGFELESRYMDDPLNDSALFAYLQTISTGGVATALRECRQWSEVSKEELLARGLAYLTKVLDSSSILSPTIRQKAEGGDAYNWSRDSDCAAFNRVFARTQQGRYVLGPRLMQPGDILCVLYGGKMPFVLRSWCNGDFLLVGECYVHGLMEGQVVDMVDAGERVEEVFNIQ